MNLEIPGGQMPPCYANIEPTTYYTYLHEYTWFAEATATSVLKQFFFYPAYEIQATISVHGDKWKVGCFDK